MCATVLGASTGYVSTTNVPFDVSTTSSGPAAGSCSGAAAAATQTKTAAHVVLPIIGDADARAVRPDRAGAAARTNGPADVLPPRDKIQIDIRPPPPRGRPVERLLRVIGRRRGHPAEAVRDPMD